MNLLDIIDLNISFSTKAGVVHASDGISLKIRQGEALCLIGESGCGKTIVALSIMRLLPGNAQINGKILFNGENLFSLREKEMRKIRGRNIAMIFEQPSTCLNPVLRVGDQIAEAVRIHEKCSGKASKERAVELMALVGIPSPYRRYRQYPHEFSGGMAQRVMIAMVLGFRPSLLIADEPTTSIDVTIQAQIMELLKDLVARFKTSLLLVTHDLGVAAQMCDSVAVMYAGEIVEKGPLKNVFKAPGHPYTQALVRVASDEGSVPFNGTVPELSRLPSGCRFHPRCPLAREICSRRRPEMKGGVRCHLHGSINTIGSGKLIRLAGTGLRQTGSATSSFFENTGSLYRTSRMQFGLRDKVIEVRNLKKYFTSGLFRKSVVKAVDGVSFEIEKGETLGLVGESGCGKSTVGRCAVRLIQPTGGDIFVNGINIARNNGDIRKMRKNMQIIFQDADGGLNPRMKVSDLLLEPLKVHGLVNGRRTEKIMELMELVNLTPDLAERYPHELSGGQRQRIGIARAISLNPEFIVADEAASSLDQLVQAQMVALLKRLQSERGISYLYISHNLKIIRTIADKVAVMYLGRFVEIGKTKDIFNSAAHPYTQALLSAVPSINPLVRQKGVMLQGEIPSPLQPPSGCRFHPRCPQARAVCSQSTPNKRRIGEDHWVRCHSTGRAGGFRSTP